MAARNAHVELSSVGSILLLRAVPWLVINSFPQATSMAVDCVLGDKIVPADNSVPSEKVPMQFFFTKFENLLPLSDQKRHVGLIICVYFFTNAEKSMNMVQYLMS